MQISLQTLLSNFSRFSLLQILANFNDNELLGQIDANVAIKKYLHVTKNLVMYLLVPVSNNKIEFESS